MNTQHSLILFDGVCNLCSSLVQFVIRHDPKHHFRFASLQSGYGKAMLQKFNLPSTEFGSFILIEGENSYTRSTAALRVVKKLNGVWPVLYAFIIVPPFIRNVVYDWVAKRRYNWFGKKEECWIPTPELRELFVG